MPSEIMLEHKQDAAWMIALWHTIHGGDPAPENGAVLPHELQEGAAARVISALSEALDEHARAAVQHVVGPVQQKFPLRTADAKVVEERLAAMHIGFAESAGGHPHAVTEPTRPRVRVYCFRFRGESICVSVPLPLLHVVG